MNQREKAQVMIDGGWRVVPLKPNEKRPTSAKWQNTLFCSADFGENDGIGIVTGHDVIALDIDHYDAAVSKAIADEAVGRFGKTLERVGQAPKAALFYRAPAGITKTDVPLIASGLAPIGKKEAVEILGKGQQCVADGIHPDTGQPYVWDGLEPWDDFIGGIDFLPAITQEQIDDFLAWVALEHGTGAGAKAPKPNGATDDIFDLDLAVAAQPLDISDEKVRQLLLNVPAADLGYDDWCKVGMALAHQYQKSGVGLKLWDDWSKLDAERYKEGETGKKWRSFGGSASPVTMATVIHMASPAMRGGTTVWDMSQDGLALELGRTGFDQDARYVAPWGKWVFWSGTRWQIDNKLSVMTKTRVFLRNKADALLEWAATHDDPKVLDEARRQAKGIKSKNTVAAIESLARSNPASIAAPEDFDTNLMTLGTPSGVVDLRTGELRPARREDMITKETAYSPADAGAVPTRWLKFLGEIFDEDQELIDFMQRVAGYSLTGETREHKLIFLYGTGRNGKSVFLNTLYEILGDYATRSASETFMASKGDKHATGLAGLKGARLVAGSELAKGKTWDEAVIKDLTGGDVISARYMRGDFFDFVPQMTLIIAGNDQPSFRGVDPAIRARVVLVPFKVRIPEKDRDEHLQDKLRAEAPAILRWAIDGCVAWEKTGLRPPKRVTEASDEYLDTEDLFGQFLADCLVEKSGDFTSTTDIFAAYQNWCHSQGTHAWSRNAVVKELKSRNFEAKATMAARGFQHVALAAGASAAVVWEFPAAEGN